MSDRPILMSAPMVRALLDGRKTQTRRLAWRVCKRCDGRGYHVSEWNQDCIPCPACEVEGQRATIWQSVKPGDRLWVRETFLTVGGRDPERARVVYAASNDGTDAWVSPSWSPSIHMPRWANRITLIVTATKMERFHEISEDDATAEGFVGGRLDDGFGERPFGDTGLTVSSPGTLCSAAGMAQIEFIRLYPDPSWDVYSSPECVALTFTVHQQNIDTLEAA